MCNEGFLLVGSSTVVCQSDGLTAMWSATKPFCERMFVGTIIIEILACVSLQCYSQELVQAARLESFCSCLRDKFYSSSTAIPCPELQKPMNGKIEAKQLTFGAKAVYSCNEGFDLTGGNQVRECLAAGSWSGKAPSCQCEIMYIVHMCTSCQCEVMYMHACIYTK